MRSTIVTQHRGGRSRGFLLNDPQLTSLNSGTGFRTLKRMGAPGLSKTTPGFHKVNHRYGNAKYTHAFPLLSHDDLGHNDHSNNTKHIELSMYMPKRNKGTAPWWRGADTYSLKYSEQSRYEYQRYLMINRFPAEYKSHFMRFLSCIGASKRSNGGVPQEALHWLQRMIVDNFNPQHVHYITAMGRLAKNGEYEMARDVWKMMERQQTWPSHATISTYLSVCIRAGELSWGLECWNRYCTEIKFLEHGEADPKPITRAPFSLTREELLHLPKWKKHFDHDPNMDVVDLNRFNIARALYSKMACLSISNGEEELFEQFFSVLLDKLITTPTPIPEPPNPHIQFRPQWGPHLNENLERSEWRHFGAKSSSLLGPRHIANAEAIDPRFLTNQQFLVFTLERLINCVSISKSITDDAKAIKICEDLFARVKTTLTTAVYGNLNTTTLFHALLRMYVRRGRVDGKKAEEIIDALYEEKAKAANAPREVISGYIYEAILRAYAQEAFRIKESKTNTPQKLMQQVSLLSQRISRDGRTTGGDAWSLDMHYQVVKCLVNCGTMKGNDYFVKNVLRDFRWSSRFLSVLYVEYRRHDDVDMWAELTKRALVWAARYDVQVKEHFKRMVENDFGTIGVHTRTMKELAAFQFQDVEEKRHARNPVNQLPNPWIDHVSHALPFPDRDTGYPNEYGELGQWRAPGGPGSPTKGPGYYAPAMEGEHQKGYTAEWRDPKNAMRTPPLPGPWDRKYKQYDRGQHPSYDMTYAGPFPEIFPQRTNFRKPTRWDFQNIEKQGKFKINGPW